MIDHIHPIHHMTNHIIKGNIILVNTVCKTSRLFQKTGHVTTKPPIWKLSTFTNNF